ncbi:MAG: hypothetical protein ACE5E9_01300 [Nitrospinaceae bacterium]
MIRLLWLLTVLLTCPVFAGMSSSAAPANSKSIASPASPAATQALPARNSRVIQTYLKTPLAFEINEGQTDGQVKFLSRGSGNAYMTGFRESTDFPTLNPLQAARAGAGDAFVSKLDATGAVA